MCSNFCDIKPTTQWYSLEYRVMYNFFPLLCSLLPRYSGQHLFFHPIVSEAASSTCNRLDSYYQAALCLHSLLREGFL